jgi:hypothetical protein
MVYFYTKNPNFGKYGRALECKILVYSNAFSYILRPLVIFYGYLVYFAVIWNEFSRFGML